MEGGAGPRVGPHDSVAGDGHGDLEDDDDDLGDDDDLDHDDGPCAAWLAAEAGVVHWAGGLLVVG